MQQEWFPPPISQLPAIILAARQHRRQRAQKDHQHGCRSYIGNWRPNSGNLNLSTYELANAALHDDLRDIAAQVGARIGLVPLSTDDQLRDAVIHAASKHDIRLEPSQIIVQRSGPADTPTIYLAADYKLSAWLPGYSFTLHFNPSTAK